MAQTKEYVFTYPEMLVIREAVTEYWLNVMKNSKGTSEIAKQMKGACSALKDQFIQDVILIRG